ncbi:VanW family protein [Jutongia sp.]
MRKNKVLTAFFVIGCIAVVGIAGFVTLFAKDNFGNKNLICDGVSIGSLDVGGLTKEQAQKKVDDYIADRQQQRLVVTVQENQIEATAAEAGLEIAEGDYAAEALQIGKKGNLWEKFQEIRKAEAGKRDIALETKVNDDTLKSFVETKCSVYDIKAKDSRLKFKNGALKATKSKEGLEVQADTTMEVIRKTLLSKKAEDADTLEVTADVEVTEPKFTQEEASQCTDLLGKYSTTYATYQVERSSNVATAAGRINGTVIYPGKTFSTIKVIKDRTEENGYKAAPEYSSGKVVSGIGGGVCQVSTTLYNAVLNAELKVIERSPHSMVVSYVPVSRDAAISGDYKDFKFKNNTDYPVYIMGSASGGILSFRVYGHETREAGREISFESEVTDTIEPGEEVVTEDPTLPASYRSVTQSAHVGYKAKLWKIVKVNGVQTEKIQVNTSAYNASPQYVTVGKQPATAAPSASAPAGSKKQKPAGTAKPSQAALSATKKPSTAGSSAAKKNTTSGSGSSAAKKSTTSASGSKSTSSAAKSNAAKKSTTSTSGGKTTSSAKKSTASTSGSKTTSESTTKSSTKNTTDTGSRKAS